MYSKGLSSILMSPVCSKRVQYVDNSTNHHSCFHKNYILTWSVLTDYFSTDSMWQLLYLFMILSIMLSVDFVELNSPNLSHLGLGKVA